MASSSTVLPSKPPPIPPSRSCAESLCSTDGIALADDVSTTGGLSKSARRFNRKQRVIAASQKTIPPNQEPAKEFDSLRQYTDLLEDHSAWTFWKMSFSYTLAWRRSHTICLGLGLLTTRTTKQNTSNFGYWVCTSLSWRPGLFRCLALCFRGLPRPCADR